MLSPENNAANISIDRFSLWNLKLLEAYFSPASKDDEVWLQLDPVELDSLGLELGGDAGFLKSVKVGPGWGSVPRHAAFVKGSTEDLVQRVIGLVQQRRKPVTRPVDYVDPGAISPMYQGCNAPTYLPFLAALVRSASSEEKGFYTHLQDALELPANWHSQQMRDLEIAWIDLERWTKEIDGKFGKFVFRSLGGYSIIGVPKSQSIMSKSDCNLISRIFSQVGARPGQEMTSTLERDVKLIASDAGFLRASFRSALRDEAFNDPIKVSLHALLEEWDGKVQPTHLIRSNGSESSEESIEGECIEVCLSLNGGINYPWQIHWRIPPLRENGYVAISRNNMEWRAPIRGTELTSSNQGSDTAHQKDAIEIVSDSASCNVEFLARLHQDDGTQIDLGPIYLREAILRVFVWNYDSYNRRDELWEHPLPMNGAAYLLTTASNAVRLFDWLKREFIEHICLEPSGLPAGWCLVCLPRCENLTRGQRKDLPDGIVERDQHRPIKLVGGRSVTRAGRRQYMFYDLPVVELDAPADAIVDSPGLKLIEKQSNVDPKFRSGIRRFGIDPEGSTEKSFLISATSNGKFLGGVTLRVASDSGEQVELGVDFSLDSQGNPQRNSSGLKGILPNTSTNLKTAGTYFEISKDKLGLLVQELELAKLRSNVSVQFLDSLAQLGSMAYGVARDQLARLILKSGVIAESNSLLLELRSRGHIEIETTAKGHLARIHSVPLGLYRLQFNVDGQSVFGLFGTPRMRHWETLSKLAQHVRHFKIYSSPQTSCSLCAWKIVTADPEKFAKAVSLLNLNVYWEPSRLIAEWAASAKEVFANVNSFAGESLGSETVPIERLNSQNGFFFNVSNYHLDSEGPSCHLFRIEDREIGRLRVYVLGIAKNGNGARYGFVRDSRWGVWIALSAFAEFVKNKFNIDDACPWPIHYMPRDGTVLLPSRINLPVILERSLNLCSGGGPDTIDLAIIAESNRRKHRSDAANKADISAVYEKMRSGKWLAYRFVPKDIATLVSEKVGGSIVEI